jgi:D-alanyl-D-alanine carboxypeptidase
MRTLLPTVLLAAAALVIPAAATAASTDRDRGPDQTLNPLLDGAVTAGFPGVIASLDDRGRAWHGAAGVSDVSTQRRMRPDDTFRAASNTKSFVATVVLQLVGERKLSLDDSVEHWLPGVLPYGRNITVRQLLNHTAGVPDNQLTTDIELFRGDRFRSWQPRELVDLIADQPQEFWGGSSWSYSNTGYVLAGMIVERATGHRLGQEVERRIIGPLGLTRTSFPVNSPYLEGPHSNGYSVDYGDDLQPLPGTRLDMTVRNPSAIWAAGNLVSNTDDLSHFFRALLRGRLLAPALLAEMKTTVATPWPGTRYGLGLMVHDAPCGRLIGHGGTMPGYQNSTLSTEDGSRQMSVMFPFSEAPEAFGEAKGTLETSLKEALCA